MKFTSIVLAALALVSSAAFATPVYQGSIAGEASSYDEAGYYIWNDAGTTDWHIRWTGIGAATPVVDWFGSIVFHNSALETTTEVSFEASDASVTLHDDFFTGEDETRWIAVTNNSGGYDGIDFSLNGSFELLEFNLGSSLFDDLDQAASGDGVASVGIFIGEEKRNPNVFVFETPQGKKYQSFEISVPEPGSLALLGLGLVGLGFSRRKQAKA